MPVLHPSSAEANPTLRLLAKASAASALLVVPNDTSAQYARQLFDDAQRAAGFLVWEPANVLSWSTWLRSLWSGLVMEGVEPRLLLNAAQEHILWHAIIEASPVDTLDAPDAIADLAQSAWSLAAAWQAPSDLRRHAHTRDAIIFADWGAAFRRACERQQALSPALLAEALCEHAAAGRLRLTTPIHFAGFDEFLPAQTALLDALRAQEAFSPQKTHIEVHPPSFAEISPALSENTTSTHFILQTEDEATELQAAAHWIRRFIEARAKAGLPHRVALIVADAASLRYDLDSVLRSVLAPELEDIAADTSSAPFTFSAGPTLASTAIIDTALALLHWVTEALPLERLSSLLLSPYFAPEADLATFSEFDAFTLRKKNFLRPELNVHELRRIATARHADDNGPHTVLAPLLDRLLEEQRRFTSGPRQRSFADWMQFIREFLRAAGWHGDRMLNRDEFQALRSWDHVLDLAATLDFRDDRVDFPSALAAVEREAGNATFIAASRSAPVQILSATEAAGSHFDALVLLRATDDAFPPTERPHPLLGWTLQNSLAMPGTDPARSTARDERLTARLIATAPSIVFSFATHNADSPQRLSPVLAKLNWPTLTAEELHLGEASTVPLAEEIFEDTAPLPPLPSNHIGGGAMVLKLQAACGFRAFAEMRLHSSGPGRHDVGFDAMQSGNVVHVALEHFWKHVRSHNQLRALSTEDTGAALTAAIDFAFTKQPAAAHPWDHAYLNLQRKRTLELLRKWLDFERMRGPFTVVESEKQSEVAVGPLLLDVRVDRIDSVTVSDGQNGVRHGLILVDYKTGRDSAPKDWDIPRPDDPQLPLYTLLHKPEEIKAVTFAKLRIGHKEMKWTGVAAADGLLPNKKDVVENLSEQLANWHSELAHLAVEFASGSAGVTPKSYPDTCKHCGQQLLCRLDATSLNIADDDTDGPGAEAADNA